MAVKYIQRKTGREYTTTLLSGVAFPPSISDPFASFLLGLIVDRMLGGIVSGLTYDAFKKLISKIRSKPQSDELVALKKRVDSLEENEIRLLYIYLLELMTRFQFDEERDSTSQSV